MRCKDVKQWISEKGGNPSPEVIEHLSRCHTCVRMVQAHRRLDDLFDTSTGLEQVPSFSAIRERVETLAANQTIQEKIVSYIKNQLRTRPGVLAGASLAVVAFLFITLVPLSYTHTTGYTVSVSDSGDENDSTLQKVEKAIAEVDQDNITVVVSSEGDTKHYTVVPIVSRVTADRIAVTLQKEIDEHIDLKVEPITIIKSDPIYAQVVSRVKTDENKKPRVKISFPKLLFDSEVIIEVVQDLDLEDAEVERRISDELIRQGLAADQIDVNSELDEDSKTRTIKLAHCTADDSEEEAEIEFMVVVGKPDGDYKNVVISMKSGKIMKVEMDDATEIGANTIIMKVSTRDSLK